MRSIFGHQFSRFLLCIMAIGLISAFYQNCGSVKLGAPSTSEEKILECSDFSASRPENIYSDASTNSENVIFRMNERDNQNFLSTSNRVYLWSLVQDSEVIELGHGPQLEISLAEFESCTPTEIRSQLAACGESFQWKTFFTKPPGSGQCPQPSTTTTTNSTTTTTNVTTTTLAPTVVHPPTETPGGWSAQTPGAVFGVTPFQVAFANQLNSFYGMASGQSISIPFSSTELASNNPAGKVQIENNPSGPFCSCVVSFSSTPGDFSPHLGKCLGWQRGDVGHGQPLTFSTRTMSPQTCGLQANRNYYFNLYCGVTDPSKYDQAVPFDPAMRDQYCELRLTFLRY